MKLPFFAMLSLIFVVSSSLCAVAQTASPAVAPGSGRPPENCGLVCEPKASLTITVPVFTGPAGLLQNQPLVAQFVAKNTSLQTLIGSVTVYGDGQILQNLFFPGTVTLAPQQQTSGIVLVTNPPAGYFTFVAYFRSPLLCTGIGQNRIPICSGFQTYASATAGVSIPPDVDQDGLSDDYENTILGRYAPLMLFSRDHGGEEEYRPTDVLEYLRGSSLVSHQSDIPGLSHTKLNQDPTQILGPDVSNPGGNCVGPDVCKGQISLSQNRTLPLLLYTEPSDTVKQGSSWDTVLANAQVGLYGHVVPILPSQIPDPDLAKELTAYMISNYPNARPLLKVEYWQFFGYSHDFQVPIPGLPSDIEHAADHDGDWCTVQLYINQDEPSPDKAILVAYHYLHGIQVGFDFTKPTPNSPSEFVYQAESMPLSLGPTYQLKEFHGPAWGQSVNFPLEAKYNDVLKPCDTAKNDQNICNAQNNVVQMARVDPSQPYVHPVVYVEWGGHEFWPSKNWKFFGAGKHGGDGYSYFAAAPPNVGEIGHPMPGPAAQLITGYGGFWGFWGGIDNINPPPPAPPLHNEWWWFPTDPVSIRPTGLPY